MLVITTHFILTDIIPKLLQLW